jgi:hypothetical protein
LKINEKMSDIGKAVFIAMLAALFFMGFIENGVAQEELIFSESFEDPDITGGSNTDPNGWTVVNGGLNDEDTLWFTTPFGAQALWINGDAATTTTNILSDVLQVNYTYTLTFNTARRNNMTHRGNTWVASLLAGSTTLASTNGAPTTSDFSESAEIVFKPGASHAALIGETLAIRFAVDTDYQPNFDNVMLTAIAPPPAGTVLIIR